MNYLAHLYLAQPNADSYFGNLLGDFGGKAHINGLAKPIGLGLKNHYLVDKFTDNHSEVKNAKLLFSAKRRRCSGIALDVLFDHFLIIHWSKFHDVPFIEFKTACYRLLKQNLALMPKQMQYVVTRITQDDWFKTYESREGVGLALDNIARRIRFENTFAGSIEDINLHFDELESVFSRFFPELIKHVLSNKIEQI